MGYIGQRYSVNYSDCLEEGIYPSSYWSKGYLLQRIAEVYGQWAVDKAKPCTLEQLRSVFLRPEGWHHTGKYYQKTDVYAFDDGMEPDEIMALKPWPKEPRKQGRPKAKPADVWAIVKWTEWERSSTFGRLAPYTKTAIAHWLEKPDGKTSKADIYDIFWDGRLDVVKSKLVSSLLVYKKLGRKPRKGEQAFVGLTSEKRRW